MTWKEKLKEYFSKWLADIEARNSWGLHSTDSQDPVTGIPLYDADCSHSDGHDGGDCGH